MGSPHHSRSRTRAFFAAAIYSEVGNGAATLFWTDRWLHGQSIADLAPHLFATISVRRRKKRTVQEALTNQAWISDIQGALTVGVLIEYLHLWDILFDFQLHPDSGISTYGDFQLMVNTLLNQPMRGSFLVRLGSAHGRKFGRLGHHPNVAFLCGLWPIRGVGQWIA